MILSLIEDIRRGIECKYPLCCVLEFVFDYHFLKVAPYEHRRKKYHIAKNGGYVPCWLHCRRNNDE